MLLPLFDGGLLCQLALWLLSRGFGKLWPLERDGFGFLDALPFLFYHDTRSTWNNEDPVCPNLGLRIQNWTRLLTLTNITP